VNRLLWVILWEAIGKRKMLAYAMEAWDTIKEEEGEKYDLTFPL